MKNPHFSLSVSAEDVEQQAINWFVRLRSESVSSAEKLAFNTWYQADASHRQAYDEIVAFWQDPQFNQVLQTFEAKTPVKATNRYRLSSRLSLAVASVAMLAVLNQPLLSCWQADYCTAVGEIRTIALADGSQVTLNSDSAMNVNLRNGLRQVQLLNGEAFFDVQRDPQHPFTVDAHYSHTQVLGTRFAVKQDQQFDQVTVTSGVVEVSRQRQNPVLLNANDMIRVTATQHSSVQSVNPSLANAWLKGRLVFDNVPLSEVIAEIGRYRLGSLLIQDPALKNLKVSGRFDITDTDKALEALQQTLPITLYRLTPWVVVIA